MPNSACEIRFDNFRRPKIKSQNGGLSCLSRANCCCVSHFPHQPISWPALFPRGVCLLSHLTLLGGECAPHDVFASSGLPSLHRAQCHQGFCGTILQFWIHLPLGPGTGVAALSLTFLAGRWLCLGGSGPLTPRLQSLDCCLVDFIYFTLWVRVCF